MKHIISSLALITLLSFQAAAQSGVVYSLPQTVVSVKVEAVREAFTAGPYAQYAQKYLGVAARTSSTTTYTLSKISLVPYVEADPSIRYSVNIPEKSYATFLKFSSQGLIAMSDNYDGKSVAWHFEPEAGNKDFAGADPWGNLGLVTSTLYKAVQTAEGFEKVAVAQQHVVEKSLDKKASDAADEIFELRLKRQQIATGDTDATFSGEALQAAIDEITRLEEKYLSLFYGISEISTVEKTFDVIPVGDESKQSYTAFRISDKLGLIPASSNGGRAVILELVKEELSAPESSSSGRETNVIHYRTPAIALCRLVDGGETLLEGRIPVYQMGEETTFPINVLISK